MGEEKERERERVSERIERKKECKGNDGRQKYELPGRIGGYSHFEVVL